MNNIYKIRYEIINELKEIKSIMDLSTKYQT